MMVTALISVARNERHAAHQGMRRRARKKSAVPRCSRLKAPPMTTRKASDAARMAKSGHVSADAAESAMGLAPLWPTTAEFARTGSRLRGSQAVEKGSDARRRPVVRVERRPLADARRELSKFRGH